MCWPHLTLTETVVDRDLHIIMEDDPFVVYSPADPVKFPKDKKE